MGRNSQFQILVLQIIQTDFNSFLPVCNGMVARHPCMARVAQGIFARNCQLANAGSRLAGKSRSLRLQTGAAPYACLGVGCRANLASRAYDSFFFLFFCSESSRISRARSPSRVSRLRHNARPSALIAKRADRTLGYTTGLPMPPG